MCLILNQVGVWALLQKDSFVPLYYQLKEIIKDKIEAEEWLPHSKIPSVRELSEIFDISTTTVKQAISELTHEGLLYSSQGKGTFVASHRFASGLTETTMISEEILLGTRVRQLGSEFSVKVLSTDTIDCNRAMARILQIDEESPAIRIRRLKCVDNAPMLVETTFISTALCPGLEKEDLTRSFFRLIDSQYSIRLCKSFEGFRPVFLDTLEADLLNQTPGCLALLNERVSCADKEKPVLYGKSLIRADMCKMYVDLTQIRSIRDMVHSETSF
jgi:GntR family transcriptional regulator